MNVGLYSFVTMDVKTVQKLSEEITHRLINVDDIFIYSENTNKERMSKRDGFKNMLQDYAKGKINVVVFQNLQTLGKDDIVRGELLQDLMGNRVKFFFIEAEMESVTDTGKNMLEATIFFSNKMKEINTEKSKRASKNKIIEEWKKKKINNINQKPDSSGFL